MTDPRRYVLRMLLFLAVVGAVVATLAQGLWAAFQHNIGLNSLILGILLIGILLDCRQVLALQREVAWLEAFRRGQPPTTQSSPRLLAPLAAILGERHDRVSLSPLALRSLLDGLAARLEENRETSRYFTGLMVFLGLLGTFWGLSQTIGSIGDVIRGLTVVSDDVQATFGNLRQGLDAPLAGMGTAFSTSMMGLAGSLVLGFLDLQAGQAQNSFMNGLEEWLSGQTKIGSAVLSVAAGDGSAAETTVPAYVQALLEQTAESIDQLQRVMTRGEENRMSGNTALRQLSDRLSSLTDQMKLSQSLMLKLAEHQLEMRPILQKIGDSTPAAGGGLDDASRQHLRNMDLSLIRLVEETTLGRTELTRELHSELRLMTRTLAARLEDDGRAPAPSLPPLRAEL